MLHTETVLAGTLDLLRKAQSLRGTWKDAKRKIESVVREFVKPCRCL